MATTLLSSGRARAERAARILLAVGVVPIVPCAVVLVWLLGFDAHPHQVGLSCVVAAIFVAIMAVSQWCLDRVRMKRASALQRMALAGESGPCRLRPPGTCDDLSAA